MNDMIHNISIYLRRVERRVIQNKMGRFAQPWHVKSGSLLSIYYSVESRIKLNTSSSQELYRALLLDSPPRAGF